MTLALTPTSSLDAPVSIPEAAKAERVARGITDLCVLAARTRFRRLYGHDVSPLDATDARNYNVLILTIRSMAPQWWASTASAVSIRARMYLMDEYARTWADPRMDSRP